MMNSINFDTYIHTQQLNKYTHSTYLCTLHFDECVSVWRSVTWCGVPPKIYQMAVAIFGKYFHYMLQYARAHIARDHRGRGRSKGSSIKRILTLLSHWLSACGSLWCDDIFVAINSVVCSLTLMDVTPNICTKTLRNFVNLSVRFVCVHRCIVCAMCISSSTLSALSRWFFIAFSSEFSVGISKWIWLDYFWLVANKSKILPEQIKQQTRNEN